MSICAEPNICVCGGGFGWAAGAGAAAAGDAETPPNICVAFCGVAGAGAGGTDPLPEVCAGLGGVEGALPGGEFGFVQSWVGARSAVVGDAAGAPGAPTAPNICVAFCGVAGVGEAAGGTDPPPDICALGPDWDG
ncbi:MAG TPA: hypothetical protein VFA20_03445, partial [Myxococcaceae bacterium]|nr:hypothetical protein [Myxococcaceae bacterium]